MAAEEPREEAQSKKRPKKECSMSKARRDMSSFSERETRDAIHQFLRIILNSDS
jgi:hypothetical protein